MPPHREDPQGGEREQASQHRPSGPDCAFHTVREKTGEQADQPLGARPGCVVGCKPGADRERDAVGNQEHEAGAEHRRSPPGQRPQPLERRERPADAKDGDDDRADAEHLP